ncbi:MAG: nucleotidyltransferase domain-containing protein [Phycisphaerae bacterium]|nr:nucleotidyltransferase domain-containing protein [Phycisphaerae bacterium]
MQGDDLLKKALTLLFEALPAGSKVILFGSWARGEARPDSDFDFLVVEPQVEDRFAEMVRLSALLGSAMIPADVVVVSRESFELWRSEPNTLAGRAAKEGRVYESAA